MSMVENQIMSKVIDEQNVTILNKFNVKETDFYALPEVYKFVKSYNSEFGEIPDYRTVVDKFDDFEYMPEVADSFGYLAKSLKSATAKRGAIEILQRQAGKKFNDLSGTDFITWLADEVNSIKENTSSESNAGENFATTGKDRWDTYEDSKENRTQLFIPTPYPTLSKYLGGGFEIGDYVLLQAYTNRGKSWIASHLGVVAWSNNFGVLHYSPELSYTQQSQRNDTLAGHFNNSNLKSGQLSNETSYKSFLDGFNEDNETPYIIKTMEHLPKGLGIDVIEADLQANPEIKMVIIDGFNLMDHKGRDGNRNNMSNTSRSLRQLFARYGVVGIVVHQTPTSAEKENKSDSETGSRLVQPPDIHQYSETIAVIQDASTVLSYDALDGVGKIKIAKARTPHVDKEITLHTDYNHGYIKEATVIDYI